MTSTRPQVALDGWYGRRETMTALGIASSTLYNYEAQGILPSHIRKSNGRRVWSGRDIIKAWNLVY